MGDAQAQGFSIEVGAVDYGFEMDGVIGMDFLSQVGAIVDLSRLVVTYSAERIA